MKEQESAKKKGTLSPKKRQKTKIDKDKNKFLKMLKELKENVDKAEKIM